MSKLKIEKVLLLIVILLAVCLRFYQLGQNPPSLAWDEAALGYNAYSIGLTGRDEFGRLLPFDYFTSFGDYKPPLYVYAAVIPVKLFGLNEFAVRFPSAFFGTLTVLLTYLLVKELFPKLKDSWLPLLAALLLAVSPWHVQLSRAAWEANLADFWVVLGIWLFCLGINRNGRWLVLSGLAFAASFYTFNSPRVFVPIFIVGLAVYYRRQLWPKRRWVVLSFLVSLVALLPLLPHLLSPEAKIRFKEVNIFTDMKVIELSNRWMEHDDFNIISRIYHNRRVLFTQSFLEHYFDHFKGGFLFISGDGNPKFSLQDVGQLYLISLPFLIFGVFYLIDQKKSAAFVLLWWLLASPLPAATARETPHALRILHSLPSWQIITAFGFYQCFVLMKAKLIFRRGLILVVAATLLLSIGYFWHHYAYHYPQEFSGEWQFGYREAINYISGIENDYQKVVFTPNLGRPYIYFLFYTQYSPEDFWQSAQLVQDPQGFISVTGFDKFEFRGLEWEKEAGDQDTLFVVKPIDVPAGVRVLKTVEQLNKEPVLVIFDSR